MSSRVCLFSPPRGHGPQPPSVTVSTYTSASNPVVFQSPAMPNARMSLCTHSVDSFSFPPRPLRVAPSRPPATHLNERPHPQKSSRAQRCLNAFTSGYLKEGHGCTRSSIFRYQGTSRTKNIYSRKLRAVRENTPIY